MASNTAEIQLQSSEVKPDCKAVRQEVAGSPVCAIDVADNQGYTPLHSVFTKSQSPEQDEETMRMLVSLGADIRTKAKNGSGIFHSAVKKNIPAKLLESFVNLTNAKVPAKYIHQENGKYKAVKGEFSWDINAVDNEGFTPMHLVAMNRGDSNNNKALLKLLVRLGANINSKTKNEETVLHLAIVNNISMEIVQELVSAGVNVNSLTKEGSTALFLAVKEYRSTIGIIEALLKGNCKVNLKTRDGFTALHLALNNSRTDDQIVKALIQSGADVNLKTSDGSTALHLAVKFHRSEDVTRDIINAGAKMEVVDNVGKTALLYTYRMSYNYRFENINLATLLVKSGAKFDVLDDWKCTPLLAAVLTNQTDLVVAMMNAEKGCGNNLELVVPESCPRHMTTVFGKATYIRVKGYTALLVAAICLDVAMVEALINGGASVNALTPERNQNALLIILENYNAKNDINENEARCSIAKLLIDGGINMEHVGAAHWSQTALQIAIEKSEEISRYLIEKGADVSIKNYSGETILHLAIKNNQHDIVKLLLKG